MSPEIIDLLCACVKAAFAGFPDIKDWHIATFGPRDFDWLGDLGISKVLLPYMWNKPKQDVLPDMEQNYALVKALGEKLSEQLSFSVTVGNLSDNAQDIDIPKFVERAYERAEIMLPVLMASPPLIFKQLRTQAEIISRVQQEAFLVTRNLK